MFQLPPVYFEHLLASSLDIVIAVDNEGQIIFYNDGAYRTLGYTLAEIRGKHVTTVYPNIEEARRVMAAMRGKEFGETGQVKNFETELVAKNGEHIPVAISGSVIYDDVVKRKSPAERVEVIFMTLLSRKPDSSGRNVAIHEITTNGLAGCGDVIWSLLNTREFLFVQ